MSPKAERPGPVYRQIADHYRNEITEGRLRVGDRIPAVRALTEEWDVAQGTVLKAIDVLKAEGFLTVLRGSAGGTFVTDAYERTASERMVASMRGKIYDKDEWARIVSADLVPAPDEVAEYFNINPGDMVIRRHRVTYKGDTPRSASNSWFSGEIAESCPLLLVAERLRQGTPKYVRDHTGLVAASSEESFEAGDADDVMAAELGVEVGSSVLVHRNWYRTDDGRLVEYGESVSPKGRQIFFRG